MLTHICIIDLSLQSLKLNTIKAIIFYQKTPQPKSCGVLYFRRATVYGFSLIKYMYTG